MAVNGHRMGKAEMGGRHGRFPRDSNDDLNTESRSKYCMDLLIESSVHSN